MQQAGRRWVLPGLSTSGGRSNSTQERPLIAMASLLSSCSLPQSVDFFTAIRQIITHVHLDLYNKAIVSLKRIYSQVGTF
jgi:hypothetical protein